VGVKSGGWQHLTNPKQSYLEKIRFAKFDKVDKPVYRFVEENRRKNILLNEDVICEKSKQFAQQLSNPEDFILSNGWYKEKRWYKMEMFNR